MFWMPFNVTPKTHILPQVLTSFSSKKLKCEICVIKSTLLFLLLLSEYEVVSTTKGPNGQEVSILTTNQTHTAVENLKPESRYVTDVIMWDRSNHGKMGHGHLTVFFFALPVG